MHEKEELEQVNALYSLLGNRYSAKVGLRSLLNMEGDSLIRLGIVSNYWRLDDAEEQSKAL